MRKEKVRYFKSFTDDFEATANENFKLREDYKWVRTDLPYKVLSGIIYGLAIIFGGLYCYLFLHMRVRGRKNLKKIKGGYFIYANHTQPIGDVFIPALAVLPKRIYTVVSTANYGIPVIGKILPFLGALPITESLHGIKELNKAIDFRIKKGHPIVIYPEAHVWEYYTDIRPFPDSSLKFPIKFESPSLCMTVTYKKSKIFKRPLMEVFLDGPFYGEGNTVKEKTADLHKKVYDTMKKRSLNSNYSYIEYISAKEKP